jgi:sugar phosphate isomerase/epimerase
MALEHVLSFQLYSSRKFPPLAEQLKTLAALGYTNVEPFGGLYDDVDGLAAGLKANGLTAVSGHFGLDMLETEFDRAVGIARTLGISLVVCPYLMPDKRPTDTAGWKALGERLAKVAAALGAQGLDFAWHNHDFEFFPLADGSLPIQHILADPSVKLELDVAWVVRAGVDPKPWVQGYAGRIASVHVKDIAPAGEKADEDGWADVGTGVVPWREMWPEAVKAGTRLMIAEHDNPSDFRRFAEVSAANMKALAG